MRIKKLELVGFKSFADKAVFEFEGPLTGLVGPNGAGKSNVVDAFKWVLGEQSARKLRGNDMTDMIFSGSATRKPLGCAEVRLTLINDRGLLPVEYDEVCLSRRCYRSGESEYFLNGSPCRLKDIRMLLMDTGVGVSAYSVIEQGQVDMLLRAGSKERRQVLEEAAGINRYLQRKKEAEQKLDRVQTNLQRVGDIIEELQRQLRSVRYQAAKARRYKRLRDELRKLRLALGVRTHRELVAEGARLAGEIGQAEDSRRALEARVAELKKEHAASQEALEKVRQELAQAEERLSHIGARHYSLGQEIEMARRRQAEIQARQDELRQRAAEEESGLAGLREEAGQTEQALQEVQKSLQARTEAHQRRTEESRAVETQCAQLEDQIEAAKAAAFDLMQQESQLQNQIGMLSAESETLANRLGRLRERQGQLQEQCDRTRADRAAAEQQMAGLRAEAARVSEQLGNLEEQLAGAMAQVERLTFRMGELKAELKEKLGRRQVLQDLEARAEGVGSGVKVVLEAIGETGSPLSGSPGLLANLVEVASRDARAVEAALGQNVQAILVNTSEQARHALRLLPEGRKGRAAVLALEDVRHVESVSLPAAADSAVRLAELVRCPEHVRAALGALLGNCFLVDDVEAAFLLLDGQLPPGVRLVTRSGACLESGGPWSAGEPETGRLISRRSELAELDREVAGLEDRLAALSQEGGRCTDDLQALQRQKALLAARREELARDENDLRSRIALLASQEEQRAEDIELLKAEDGSLREEIERTRGRMARSAEELEGLRRRQAQRQSELGALQDMVSAQRRQREQIAADLSALRSELSRMEEQQSSLRTLADRLQDEVQRRQKELDRIQAEQHSSVLQQQETAQRVRAAEEDRKNLEHEKAQLEARIIERSRARDRVQEAIAGINAELEKLNARQGELNARLEELHVKQSEVRLRCDNLRERAGEECGMRLEAFELEPERWREQSPFTDMQIEEFQDRAVEGDSTPVARWYAEAQRQAAGEQEPDSGPTTIKLAEAVDLRSAVLAMAGSADTNWDDVRAQVGDLREKLDRMGGANLDAIREQDELEARAQFLTNQRDDLEKARRHELEIIRELSRRSRESFVQTFEAVRQNFQVLVRKLFGGGTGDLLLEPDQDVLEAGIEIMVKPPGKETRSISLLSGGEKALSAVALLFAIFEAKPSPFCLLDEVDAPLDEANIGRFLSLIEEYKKNTQFVIVTHSKLTMSATKALYGISLIEDGVSKKLAVDFEEVDRRLAEMARETRLAMRHAKAG